MRHSWHFVRRYLEARAAKRTTTNRLFVARSGKPLSYSALYFLFCRLAKAAGVPQARPHALRHGHAMLMLWREIPPADIQAQLGHSSLRMTERYLHVTDPARQERYLRAAPLEKLLDN